MTAPKTTDDCDPAPKTEGPASLQDAIRALTMRATVDALELSKRVSAARDQFDGTVLSGGDGSGVSSEPRRQPGELVYEVVRAHLQMANELLTVGQREADFWLDRLQRLGTASLPREQRPPVRVNATLEGDEKARWKVYVYNAAHEARAVSLVSPTGRWTTPSNAAWAPTIEGGGSPVVPPRGEIVIEVTHFLGNDLQAPGDHYAEVEVRMRGAGDSSTATLVVSHLELSVTVPRP